MGVMEQNTTENLSPSTKARGDIGEERAIDFLLEKNYELVCRKYRSKRGEIDCVMKTPDGTLVFVEVKSASGGACGNPFSWITPAKQRTIVNVAKQYLAEHHITSIPCRFDCIAVFRDRVEHIKNAFLAR
jgi:putative endonuclease